MEGASLTSRCVQGPPRAARRSEWLRSALLHHHCPDSGVQNEIVVLATGIDQYLQEVFHHLAHPNEEDTVSSEDFCSLCALLGVSRRRSAEDKEDDDEFKDICSDLPPQLCFKEFHSRLCGYFRAGSSRTGEARLPVTEDTELVERQIRVRWPRVRRKYVSFDLDQTTKNKELHSSRMTDEVSALRELVEDLRSALQGSDARCLALEVALRREKTRVNPPAAAATVSSPTSITFAHGKLVPTSRIKGDGARRLGRRRDIRDPLARELKLIRSSRDGQLNEAIKFNKHLEEEVRWAYQAVRKLQAEESALRRENTLIRRRAEEAREALSLGLQRVQVIQKEAELVPQLQTRITQLEKEVHEYRSSCTCTHNHLDPDPQAGEDISSKSGETCLQRAVEGKDASDEEEDGGGGKERALVRAVEVKKCSGRLHGSSEGSLQVKVLTTQQRFDPQHRTHVRAEGDSDGLCSQKRRTAEQPVSCRNYGELQAQKDNARGDQRERTFLSAVEEKFRDALMLLLQLRNKSVSCLQMDRIVMDVCGKSGDCPTQVLHVADSLCLHLSSNDTVREQRRVLGRQTGGVGTLLISC